MPIYEFQTADGDVVEMVMPFSEFDRRVKDGKITLDDGREATSYFNPYAGISSVPGNYPYESDACGVHPAQAREQIEHLRQMGCGFVEHSKDGNPIFQDKGQRKRVCEALGLFDRNGGFSDPQPKHRTANVRKFR